jgi:tRNA A37 threonylcarbamoyladenosine dehydratase
MRCIVPAADAGPDPSLNYTSPMDQRTRDAAHRERFGGVDRLYGQGAIARLAGCHVAVIGLGGVGSWAVEALVRSGVGRFTLVDADDVCVSNSNRQLHAVAGQFGRNKAELLAERCRAINPHVEVEALAQFLTPPNLASCWTVATTSCSTPATVSAARSR